MTNEQRRRIHEAMVHLAHGHREAFSVVFDGLWPNVLRFVTRAMPDHPDAEDVAQQTLLKVFSRITDFDTSRDGVSWAFGIASYEVMTLRQQLKRRREVPVEQAENHAAATPTPEDATIERDLKDALAETLGTLSRADYDALLAAPVDLQVSPATWRKRRQRALERLRTAWRRRHA